MRISFRRLAETDLPLLTDWLNRPHVAERWEVEGGRSAGNIRREFVPKMAEGADVAAYIAELDGRPAGYIQSYRAMDAGDGWWLDERDPGVWGIDQFLADAAEMGHGVGTEMVREFVRLLFENPGVTKIQVDPAPDNIRAIRCYENVGFKRIGTVTTPDGPALLMVLERS